MEKKEKMEEKEEEKKKEMEMRRTEMERMEMGKTETGSMELDKMEMERIETKKMKAEKETEKGRTEMEKCLAGELYDCHARVFLEGKARAAEWCGRYNAVPYARRAERREMLEELFGGVGENVSVGDGFTCDFGVNIFVGSNVSINKNCTFIDCNRIIIGSNVLIAPHVHLNTATHPVELAERLTAGWTMESGEYFCRTRALPIRIGNGCWIGANVVVLAGVSIGDGAVVGAGSVVTRDVPPNVLAAGNPCRIIREINR